MPATEDLTVYFSEADFADACTVGGVAAQGIFDSATELMLGEALVLAPSLLLPATVAAADGTAVVVRGVSYVVRQVLDQPPDGVLRRLVLALA